MILELLGGEPFKRHAVVVFLERERERSEKKRHGVLCGKTEEIVLQVVPMRGC